MQELYKEVVIEAMANADAHMSNVDLPTYSQLAAFVLGMALEAQRVGAVIDNDAAQEITTAIIGLQDILMPEVQQ